MPSQITSLTIVYATVYSRRRSKKISKLRITGLSEGISPVTSEFPAQRASNAENVSFDDVIMDGLNENDIQTVFGLCVAYVFISPVVSVISDS